MNKISFPAPEHEKAVAIMEQAQKDLAALGYDAGFVNKLHSDGSGAKFEIPVFHISFFASKVSSSDCDREDSQR